MLEKPHISPKKRLAPLGTEGPVQLLNLQITELGKENQMLKEKVKSLETVATSALSDKEAQAEKLSQELRRKEEELAKVAAEKEKEENTASAGKHEEVIVKNRRDIHLWSN